QRVAALQNNLNHVRRVEQATKERVAASLAPLEEYLASSFYMADAEVRLYEATAGPIEQPTRQAAMRRVAAALMVTELDRGRPVPSRATYFPSALQWSRRLVDADMAVRRTRDARLAAAKAYLDRNGELEKLAKEQAAAGKVSSQYAYEATYFR